MYEILPLPYCPLACTQWKVTPVNHLNQQPITLMCNTWLLGNAGRSWQLLLSIPMLTESKVKKEK